MPNYLTFQNIYQAVERAIRAGATADTTLVKSIVNQVYLNEVMQADDLHPLFWMLRLDDSIRTKTRATITGITIGSDQIDATAHGFANGDVVTIYGIVGTVELNGRTFKVANSAADSFTLTDLAGTAIDMANMTAWSSGGHVHHRGVTLSTNLKSIHGQQWHDEGYDNLRLITPQDLEKDAICWDESTSRPGRLLHQKTYSTAGTATDILMWFQGPDDNYTLRMWVEDQPTRMSSDSDVPQLPPQFHDTLVSGAITRLVESNVQVENAVIWPSLYASQLAALKTFNRNWWDMHRDKELSPPYML